MSGSEEDTRLSVSRQTILYALCRAGPQGSGLCLCAEHVRQLGGASPLHNVMDVK